MHRWFKVGAVALGYLIHLILDELYSVQWRRGRLRLKKSSGTALKIWGDNLWANLFTFANLTLLAYVLFQQPLEQPDIAHQDDQAPTLPREANQQSFESHPLGLERR